jgi:hypothetical protein
MRKLVSYLALALAMVISFTVFPIIVFGSIATIMLIVFPTVVGVSLASALITLAGSKSFILATLVFILMFATLFLFANKKSEKESECSKESPAAK